MKDIRDLGISPWPWGISNRNCEYGRTDIISMDGQAVFCYDHGAINKQTPNNALVMAASPELYEALFDIMRIELSGTWDDVQAVHKAFEKAEAALLKASGERL